MALNVAARNASPLEQPAPQGYVATQAKGQKCPSFLITTTQISKRAFPPF